MPKQDRIKTKYPGVYYIAKGKEKVFYIVLQISTASRSKKKLAVNIANDMTAAKAAGIRADRSKGKEPSNNARREEIKATKLAEAGKDGLWTSYGKNTKQTRQILKQSIQTGEDLKNT
jgi:hypothetical protein